MIRIRKFKAGNDAEIEAALTDLPENSFRQLIPMGKVVGLKELYMVVFELTEEQEKTWTPTYALVETTARQFVDY